MIKRVEQLGRRDNQPEILVFTDKQGEEYEDDSRYQDPEDLDDYLSYGTEYQVGSDHSTGVSDDTSIDSDVSANVKPHSQEKLGPIGKIIDQVNSPKISTPGKYVMDVSLPDSSLRTGTGSETDAIPKSQDEVQQSTMKSKVD